MEKINVLVLGVGGNVSQGILKAIAISGLECRVVGACVSQESVGLYFCDVAYIAPYANSQEFIPWLIDICNKEKISIIFSGVEENIMEISANLEVLSQKTKAVFKCSKYEYLKIGQDKLRTCCWLKENDCNFPKYCASENVDAVKSLVMDVGYPLIAKPRIGKGSDGVMIISNKEELRQALMLPNYVVQELIGNENTEYTVGCYCDKAGKLVDIIIMHRRLKNGTTFKAEVVENDVIRSEAVKICEKFGPTGPLNIQLRLDKNESPVCFELNVRFSGTTPMRAHFGFNDVAAMIKEYVLNQDISHEFSVRKGTSYRFMSEMYFEEGLQLEIMQKGFVSDMKRYNISVDKF